MDRMSQVLERLAQRHGISGGFRDNGGVDHQTTDDCRKAFLAAMDVPCGTEKQAELMEKLEIAEWWQESVDAFMTCRMNEANDAFAPQIELRVLDQWTSAKYLIEKEEGGTISGSAVLSELSCEEEITLGDQRYRRLVFHVPEALGPGFHMVHFEFRAGDDSVAEKRSIEVLVHQHACYLPPDTLAGKKKFGFEIFPRNLRSESNWGAGNFPDLRRLGCALAKKNVDFLFVPPLVTNEPIWGFPSPYYTSTRRQVNHQLVGLEEAMAEFSLDDCLEAVQDSSLRDTQQRLRQAATIVYTEHDPLVVHWLEKMWNEFSEKHAVSAASLWDERSESESGEEPACVREFRDFVCNGGEELLAYIDYAIGRETFFSVDNLEIVHPDGWNFRTWPLGFQHPGAERLVALRKRKLDRAGFYAFILWLGRRELSRTQKALTDAGMSLGLWMALAVGSAQGGADHFSEQDVALHTIEMGAPGDALAPDPQKWSTRARDPQRRRTRRYRPLRRDLEFTMPHIGGVFVDHGMIVQHVFGVLRKEEGIENAYLEYERDEILGILAYYSHKYQCVVGVEAVGTIPEGFEEYVQGWNVIVYYIQRFTRKDWESREYLRSGDHPWLGLLCNAGHDIAPPAGFWHEWDVMLWQLMGYPEDDISRIKAERAVDRHKFVEMLIGEGLITRDQANACLELVVGNRSVSHDSLREIEAALYPDEMLIAEAESVLRSNSAFTVLDLHSLLGHKRMFNAPGIDQPKEGKPGYECWLQWTGDADAIAKDPVVVEVLKRAAEIRPR